MKVENHTVILLKTLSSGQVLIFHLILFLHFASWNFQMRQSFQYREQWLSTMAGAAFVLEADISLTKNSVVIHIFLKYIVLLFQGNIQSSHHRGIHRALLKALPRNSAFINSVQSPYPVPSDMEHESSFATGITGFKPNSI